MSIIDPRFRDPRPIVSGPLQMGAGRAPAVRRPAGAVTPRPVATPPQRPSPAERTQASQTQAQTSQIQRQTANISPTVQPGSRAPLTQGAHEEQALAGQQHQQSMALEGLRQQQAQATQQAQLGHERELQQNTLGQADETRQFEGGQAALDRDAALARIRTQQEFEGSQVGAGRQHELTLQSSQGEQALAQLAKQGELGAKTDVRRAGLANEAFQNRWQLINSLPPIDEASAKSNGAADEGIPTGEAGARSAAFARAKEQSGRTALTALKAIKDQFAGSGLTASAMEAGAIGDVVGGAAGGVNEFTRDQMIMDLARSGQIADRDYAGALSKRSQDLGYRQSLLGLLGQGIPSVY